MRVDETADLAGEVNADEEFWQEFLAQHAELTKKPATRPMRTGKQRKLPWRDMSMADGSPLRTVAPDDLDVDGDPFGPDYDDVTARAAERVVGLAQFGHGFMVESVARPADPVRCRFCGGPMPRKSTEWLCEFDAAWTDCSCNACLVQEQDQAGLYRGRGRPRTQCGAAECRRQAATERKRKSRAQ
jgi:hypothetical protein